jgi:hypothetical protein
VFEEREGKWVGDDWKQSLRLAFEAREGVWGGDVVGQLNKADPSDSHLKQGRGVGSDVAMWQVN